MMELIIFMYIHDQKSREVKLLEKRLNEYDDHMIKNDQKQHTYLYKYLQLRREKRYIKIEIFIYSMRLILLVKNLKLFGNSWLDPIFVSICGMLMALSVMFKTIRSKFNFFYTMNIDEKPKEGEGKKTTEQQPQQSPLKPLVKPVIANQIEAEPFWSSQIMNEVSPFRVKVNPALKVVNHDDFTRNSRQLSIIEESVLDDLVDDKATPKP